MGSAPSKDNQSCFAIVWKIIVFLQLIEHVRGYLFALLKDTSRPMLCVNDKKTEKIKEKMEAVIAAFETILGEKSQFER